jgi:photosynthetic reaction center cytochrome c subunit
VTPGSRLIIVGAMVTAAVSASSAQQASPPRPPMAEDVFKNVQVLKGIPVNQFMETMGFFSASLGADCTFCHVTESGGSWEKYADDIQRKRAARGMVTMVAAINKGNFGGRQVVTCYTCHRGGNRPKVTPSLAALYGAAPPEEEDFVPAPAGAPTADAILDKYIRAVGSAARLSAVTSVATRGTYQGYDDPQKRQVEIYAATPARRAMIVHVPDGDSRTIYDGRSGWLAAPLTQRPLAVVALAGGDLDAARLEAQLSFPARIRQFFVRWRTGSPAMIQDRDVDVVQGSTPGRAPATFFFDKESGLLTRLVRYVDSPVGRIPMQTDYADYREVSGIKLPFRISATWLDGRSAIELTDVRINIPIPASTFARPIAQQK